MLLTVKLFTGITQLPKKSLDIYFGVCFFLSGYPAIGILPKNYLNDPMYTYYIGILLCHLVFNEIRVSF